MRTALLTACVLGLAGGAGLSGCSTPVGRTSVEASAPAETAGAPADGAPTWDGVMPGDYLAAGSDLSRRDDSLNPQTPGPLLASNQWPHASRPSFERARRVFLPRNARAVLQFLPPSSTDERR